MSSATASLFASFALAALGAAGLAYSLSHPGTIIGLLDRVGVTSMSSAEAPPGAPSDTAHDGTQPASVASQPGAVTLPAGEYGHFLTEAEINGRPVDVMVDTGASLVALSYDDAGRAGIFVNPSDFTHAAQTANGIARVAPVTISSIQIGDITVRNVQAVVSERGASQRTLLGMSFLGRLSRVEMRGDTLLLEE
ncbi:TIGR02281 family clan AA aspartic protease [Hyphomicrobium sp.]|jgi:aspartyl protease family protein|uniref:retropepsin-like aspartic protease family protein n=1 Tax=Hyphomicrobium sp. TaxID=82 RepID=UPI003567D208